jgi:hypothetical protein
MKKSLRIMGTVAFLMVTAVPVLSPPRQDNPQTPPQNEPVKKPPDDYMSRIMSRNTKPLGFKDDQALKRLLAEPSINWAVRAAARHILD